MYRFFLESFAHAQTAAVAASRPQSMLEGLLPVALMFFVFYIVAIRPKQKQMKDHLSFVGALKRGDQVVTTGGILGEVAGLTEQFITLQIADNVKIKVLRSQITKFAGEEKKS